MLKRDARLGFHSYRVEASYSVPIADPGAEQEKDRVLFAKRNVEDWFLQKMYDRDASDMWFPAREELLSAGVITGLED